MIKQIKYIILNKSKVLTKVGVLMVKIHGITVSDEIAKAYEETVDIAREFCVNDREYLSLLIKVTSTYKQTQ